MENENKHEFIFTRHMRERFLERSNKKYNRLSRCRCRFDASRCEECEMLNLKIREELKRSGSAVDREIVRRLGQAEENRSYTCNSEFMARYYEKYGYDKNFQFLVDGDIVFVVVFEDRGKVIVTCLHSRYHIAGRLVSRPKFKKKQA